MTTLSPPSETGLPDRPADDIRIDHALSLLLADQPETALQWAAAILQRDPTMPSALVLTSRLLEQLGRTRAAVDGLQRAVDRAIEMGQLALAMAAISELRALGVDVREVLDRVARAFCRGSSRLGTEAAPAAPPTDDFQPLSPFLTGPALASKAAQILQTAVRDAPAEADPAAAAPVAPVPLFSALPEAALADLMSAFETVNFAAGQVVAREGEEEAAGFIVASGELEVSRHAGEGKPAIVLARVGPGVFFGEMELLSAMPRTTSVTATRPSIVLVAKRDALNAVAARHPEVAAELAAQCRRRVMVNLGRGSPLLQDVPAHVRAKLLERLEARLFRQGDKLVREGEEALGLHLVVSGEVVVVAREGDEPVLLATLTPGETVGEVELVLCRTAQADAIAVHPTATLFLPRWEFFSLVEQYPAILPAMYMAAVRRHAEAKQALEAASVVLTTDGHTLGEATPEPKPVIEPIVEPKIEPTPVPIAVEDRAAAELAARLEAHTPAPPRSGGSGWSPPRTPGGSIAPTSSSVGPRSGSGAWGGWIALGGAVAGAAAVFTVVLVGATRGSSAAPSAANAEPAPLVAVPVFGGPVQASASAETPPPAASPARPPPTTPAAPTITAAVHVTPAVAVAASPRRSAPPLASTPSAASSASSAPSARSAPSASAPAVPRASAPNAQPSASLPTSGASSATEFGGRN